MKKLILLLLIIFLFGAISCKKAEEGGFIESTPSTEPTDDSADETISEHDRLFIDGWRRIPTQEEINYDYFPYEIGSVYETDENLYRAPHYYECKMLKNWVIGIDQDFFFGRQASNYNGQPNWNVRFDKDGASHTVTPSNIFGDWYGSCYIEINRISGELLYVSWRSYTYLENILDRR